jgi:hypothetical protein
MCIGLPQAELVSLGFATFLDGASTKRLDNCFVTVLAEWIGVFFTFFSIMLSIMFLNPTGCLRRLRVKVLPMSFLMLLVATMVRAFPSIRNSDMAHSINTHSLQHLIIIWVRAANAFVFGKGGSITVYYNDLSDPAYIALITSLWIQTILGDFVIVSRLSLLLLCY